MFLGAGVGLLVGNSGTGAFIGMGFVAMALLGRGATPLLGLGALLLAVGVAQLRLDSIGRILETLFLALMGLGFLWWGVSLLRSKAGQS